MIETRVGRKHGRHRTRQEADRLAAEYEASGLTREEFCAQKNVPLKSLSRYVARYRKQAVGGKETPQLVAVEVVSPSGGGELSVVLPRGRRIEVKRGFDADTLRELLIVLEQV